MKLGTTVQYQYYQHLTRFLKLLYRRLSKFWNKYQIFMSLQFGFCGGQSTTLLINQLYESILYKNDQDKSCITIMIKIFLDLSKSFDNVNHNTLLTKHYDTSGIVNNLSSCLSNRQYFVSSKTINSHFTDN